MQIFIGTYSLTRNGMVLIYGACLGKGDAGVLALSEGGITHAGMT